MSSGSTSTAGAGRGAGAGASTAGAVMPPPPPGGMTVQASAAAATDGVSPHAETRGAGDDEPPSLEDARTASVGSLTLRGTKTPPPPTPPRRHRRRSFVQTLAGDPLLSPAQGGGFGFSVPGMNAPPGGGVALGLALPGLTGIEPFADSAGKPPVSKTSPTGTKRSPATDVPDAEEYFAFKPRHVAAVIHRLHQLNASAPIEHQWISRSEYREVFTDYEALPVIQLPLRMFDYFLDHVPNRLLPPAHADDAEPGKHAKIRVGEVLLLLFILCDASRHNRGMFIKSTFLKPHSSDDGSVSQSAFKPILYMLCSAAFKAGMDLDHQPSKAVVDKEASPYGATNVVTSVQADQWIDFHLLSGRLLRRMVVNRKARVAEGIATPSATPVAADAKKAQKGSRRRSRSRRRSKSKGKQLPPGKRRRPASAGRAVGAHHHRRRREDTGFNPRAGVLTTHQVMKEKARVGKLLAMLQRTSSFSGGEVRQLYDKFREFADKEGRLDMHRFYQLLCGVYPQARTTAGASLASLFDYFDANATGNLDVKEFVEGMNVLLRGQPAEKCAILFEVFDENGDRELRPEDIIRLLRNPGCLFAATNGRAVSEMQQMEFANEFISLFSSETMEEFSINKSALSKTEFVQQLCRQPILYDCLVSVMLPGMDTAQQPFREVKHRATRFSMKSLFGMWMRCTQASGRRTMTKPQFRTFFEREFKCDRKMLPLVNRVFDVLDEDNNHILTWQEIFNGLSRVVGRSVEDRAQFFFSLYDHDDSGEVGRDEILHAVMSTQNPLDDPDETQKRTIRIMATFDSDGDNSVSATEFTSACIRQPGLLEVFGSLFGSHEAMAPPTPRPSKRRRSSALGGPRRLALLGKSSMPESKTAGIVRKAAAAQEEAMVHIQELRADAVAHKQLVHRTIQDTQVQLHGLGVLGKINFSRRRSTSTPAEAPRKDVTAVQKTPRPQDARSSRRSSLPDRILAAAAMRAAHLVNVTNSTRRRGEISAQELMEMRHEEQRRLRLEREAREKALRDAAEKARLEKEAKLREARRRRKEARQAAKPHASSIFMAAQLPSSASAASLNTKRSLAGSSFRYGRLSAEGTPKHRTSASTLDSLAEGSDGGTEGARTARSQGKGPDDTGGEGGGGEGQNDEPGGGSGAGDGAAGGLKGPLNLKGPRSGPLRLAPTSRCGTPGWKAPAATPAQTPRGGRRTGPMPELGPHQRWRFYSYHPDGRRIEVSPPPGWDHKKGQRKYEVKPRRELGGRNHTRSTGSLPRGSHLGLGRRWSPTVDTDPRRDFSFDVPRLQLDTGPEPDDEESLATWRRGRRVVGLGPASSPINTRRTSVHSRLSMGSTLGSRMPVLSATGRRRRPPRRSPSHFDAAVNVHRIKHERLPRLVRQTGLEMSVGPATSQGAAYEVHRHLSPTLSVHSSPAKELRSPYALTMPPTLPQAGGRGVGGSPLRQSSSTIRARGYD